MYWYVQHGYYTHCVRTHVYIILCYNKRIYICMITVVVVCSLWAREVLAMGDGVYTRQNVN